jgi:hypothetical protein
MRDARDGARHGFPGPLRARASAVLVRMTFGVR